jgi:hypothetical protein
MMKPMLAFAAPAFLLGLLLVPVVILLHFVRRARRSRTVSALWLWPGEEAPSRRARFSPTWLLFLQLLTIIAASLGAAGPRLDGLGREVAIVMDAGASMAATDVLPSRFEVARREALALAGGSARVTVVRAGLAANVIIAATADRSEARRALEGLTPGDARVDLLGAIALARSLAPRAELHVWSGTDLPTETRAVLHTVRGTGRNVGITAFQLRGLQLFAALESNATVPRTARLRLERDGRTIGSINLSVPGGGRAIWTPKVTIQPGQYRLILEGQDALSLDDTAVTVVNAGRVLVSPPQDDVLRAVASVPFVRVATQTLPPASSRGFDVMVLVGHVPRALPAGQYLVFAPLAPNPRRGEQPVPLETVSGWDAASGLLRFADLEGVRARVSSVPPPEIPGGTWTTLARAGTKPLILRGEGPDVRAVYIASHPLDSDLRGSPAFPVMVFNALSEFVGAPALSLGSRLPDGEVELDAQAAPGVTRALLPGVYRVNGRGFTANLVSSEQTRFLTGTSGVKRLGQEPDEVNTSAPPAESPWRTLLLAVALLALLGEAFLRGGGRFGGLFERKVAS